MTNRSRRKMQCCKSAEFYTYYWLYYFSVSTNFRFDFWLSFNFFLIFRAAKFFQYEAQFRFRELEKKLFFYDNSSNSFAFLLLVLKGQMTCPKEYDSPRSLCAGQICDFNSRELLIYFEFSLSSRSARFFYMLLLLLLLLLRN